MTAARWLVTGLLALVLLFHPYIDLGVALPLPLPGGATWDFDAPLSDLIGMALAPAALLLVLARGRPWPGPPSAVGWGLLLLACLLSLCNALDPSSSLHHLFRKPLFVYLVHGIGLSWAVARLVPPRRTLSLVVAACGVLATVSLATSVVRLAGGDALWFQPIAGLTPNHKTLAVCLAGWVPLLVLAGRRRIPTATPVLMLAVVALFLSASKTAWLGGLLAAACFLPAARPWIGRPRRILPIAALAVGLMVLSPVLMRSRAMLDATRARHSLNVRAWRMFQDHPLVGSGTGTSTQIELVTFPHYRINGVDAHGAIQKIAGETGALGLLGFGLFVGLSVGRLRRRSREDQATHSALSPTGSLAYGGLATFIVLHGELLLSTELLSPTHWVPLGTAWGLAMAHGDDSQGPAEPARSTA
ncbi:MAG: O-antigen ligase family protein [Alphaproteobacteria bacterium]|nr:O-antigen ligase family protein [Alphaproteobacteria bacterium]